MCVDQTLPEIHRPRRFRRVPLVFLHQVFAITAQYLVARRLPVSLRNVFERRIVRHRLGNPGRPVIRRSHNIAPPLMRNFMRQQQLRKERLRARIAVCRRAVRPPHIRHARKINQPRKTLPECARDRRNRDAPRLERHPALAVVIQHRSRLGKHTRLIGRERRRCPGRIHLDRVPSVLLLLHIVLAHVEARQNHFRSRAPMHGAHSSRRRLRNWIAGRNQVKTLRNVKRQVELRQHRRRRRIPAAPVVHEVFARRRLSYDRPRVLHAHRVPLARRQRIPRHQQKTARAPESARLARRTFHYFRRPAVDCR